MVFHKPSGVGGGGGEYVLGGRLGGGEYVLGGRLGGELWVVHARALVDMLDLL